jgi:glycosyltransferase involved in cell wall biosynthesis
VGTDLGLREEARGDGEASAQDTGEDALADRLIFGWKSNDGAVAYYRIEQPLDVLARRGFQAAYGTLLPRELWPGGHAELREKTTIIGQMTAGEKSSELWQKMCAEGQRCFYEMDDDIFTIDRSNPAWADMAREGYRESVAENLRVATGVIVTRRPLADAVRQHTDAPVYVIPNYIPGWLLEHPKTVHPAHLPQAADTKSQRLWRKNMTVVGWAGSSAHTMDWDRLAPRLVQFVQREPSVVLHLQGEMGYLGRFHKEIPTGRLTGEGWIPNVANYLKRICMDIAVLPLKKHVFNESKSWIKALEMAAYGIPCVASDVGPYHDFVVHGKTGFLFKTPGEMAQYLGYLVHDPQLRADMSVSARYIAEQNTYEGNAWKWPKALFDQG